MSIRSQVEESIAEASSAVLTATVRDLDGNGIPAGELDTLLLTLYDEATRMVINGRDRQSILNENDGTVNVSGGLVLTLGPDDTPIVDGVNHEERHVALLEWSWEAGSPPVTYHGKHEVAHRVKNLRKVPVE